MRTIVLIVGLVLLTSGAASAETIVAASCSSADVQTAINAAVSGDTVELPAPCSPTWNAVVTVPSTKGITLDFKGAIITCGTPCNSNSSPILDVTANATVSTRVTGFTFQSTGGSDALEVFMTMATSEASNDARFRIDNCTFDGDAIGFHLQVSGRGYGLIDHCTFLWEGNNEVIQHTAYGPDDDTGWSLDITPGSVEALYVEDSTFTNRAVGAFFGGKTLMAYGGKIVMRFNTVKSAVLDVHGNTPPSGRYWEFYHNAFTLDADDNVSDWFQIRGGTGFIFDNSSPSTGAGGKSLTLWEEDTGNPAEDQIGRGKCSALPCTAGNQASTPAYIWNKDVDMPLDIDDAACGGCIIANNSYYIEGASFDGTSGVGVGTIASRPSTCTAGVAYWATDEGEWWAANAGADGRLYKCTATNTWTLYYTPYTYPHDLQGGGGGESTPVYRLRFRVAELFGSVFVLGYVVLHWRRLCARSS